MGYHRILAAVSDLNHKNKALMLAKILAEKSGAQVTLLYVIKKLSEFGLHYSLPLFSEKEEEHLESSKNKLQYLADKKGIEGEVVVEYGTMKKAAIHKAKELKPDLLIIRKESLARKLLVSVSCDLLVLYEKK